MRLEKSFANSLIIVSVLAVATFGIVGLYKFRCTKVLVGYMMLSSVLLLGVMGGVLIWTTFDRFQIPCDSATFLFACYNFGVVGVVSIFYQAGVPTFVTQSYLVATSVLMAWQLSHFEEWTGWCLLVTLAAYDLCAVLTPCGPLKALVSLMQERGEPMPGLLYEAALPAKASDKAASFVSPGTHDPHYAAVGDGGPKAEPPPGTAAPSGAATFGGGRGRGGLLTGSRGAHVRPVHQARPRRLRLLQRARQQSGALWLLHGRGLFPRNRHRLGFHPRSSECLPDGTPCSPHLDWPRRGVLLWDSGVCGAHA